MTTFALLLACIIPLEAVTAERCDMCEINNYYDCHGNPVFVQVVWRNYNPRENRYDCIDWRLVKNNEAPINGVSQWHDGEGMRRVEAGTVVETWTQYDSEMIDRDTLPQEHRRKLKDTRRFLPPTPGRAAAKGGG